MRFVIEASLNEDSDRLVLLLTGRCQPASHFLSLYSDSSLDCNYVAIQPMDGEWYPIPNGAKDQKSAVIGIRNNLPDLHKTVKKIISDLGISKDKTSLVGFSAGGVMALELNAHNREPFHSIVIHAGAILRTNKFPESKNRTPILLIHNRDDDCFEWEERFIPMCQCLRNKRYNFSIATGYEGKHEISVADIEVATQFLSNDIFPSATLS